jgi:hypothetical protein
MSENIYEKASNAIERSKALTTKQRKSMKKSTFCGPGRSFPVNDCQHVGTAKAFLNRSKFSKSTKQKIAACINRKEKQLGCGKGKPAKAKGKIDIMNLNDLKEYTFIRLSSASKKLYSSDIFAETKNLVDESIKNPDMELEWTAE